jgi:cell division protein FtsB
MTSENISKPHKSIKCVILPTLKQMNVPFKLPRRWLLYLLGFLSLSLLILSTVGERGALHLWRLRGEKAQLDEQNYRLQKENETFRQRISKLRNDNFYLEKMAREDLNLVRPGEIIYRFPPSEPTNSGDETVSGDRSESRRSAAQKERRQSPR